MPLPLAALMLLSTSAFVVHQPSSRADVRHSSSSQRLLGLRGGELAPSVPSIETEEELELAFDEAGAALVVVDFYAEWCGPCKKLAPTYEQLAAKAKPDKVVMYKVDVDNARELAAARGVKSMPTIQFYRNGEKVHQIVGGDIAALKAEVAKAMMNPLVRFVRSEKVLAAIAALYLVFPWQRLKYA